MNVIDAAATIGLAVTDNDVTGTVDQDKVLGVLAALAASDPDHTDLFDEAAARVRRARSAGVEDLHAGHTLDRAPDVVTTQLRYRAEMVDIFTDLAIDIGLRQQAVGSLVDAAS